jgi:hypothetical protein
MTDADRALDLVVRPPPDGSRYDGSVHEQAFCPFNESDVPAAEVELYGREETC